MTSKEKYINFCNQVEVPLFFNSYWWEMINPNWEVLLAEKSGVHLFFPYFREKKIGFRFIRNPFFTPYSGFIFNQKIETISTIIQQELIDEILIQLPSFSEFNIDLLPIFKEQFSYSNFKKTIKKSNILTLTDAESIYKNYKPALQRQIKKAKKNLHIVESNDIELLFSLHTKTLHKRSEKNTTPLQFYKQLWACCQQNNCGKLFFIEDDIKNIHAGILITYDATTTYYLIGGTNEKFYGSGAMSYLMSFVIEKSIELHKKYFDFEGSMIPSIDRFFKNFNPTEINYINIQQSNNIILRLIKRK